MDHLIYPIYNGSFSVGMGKTGFFPDVKNIPSYAFLIVNESTQKAVLIDTGFSKYFIPGIESSAVKEEDTQLTSALERLGFKAEDIETVVMTHLHWDHTGAMNKFSNARFLIQAQELRSLVNIKAREECSFCPSHFLPLLHRFELLEGSCEITPGLKVLFTGGHTAGHQTIEVQTRQGKIVLLGDAPFNYTLMWEKIPQDYWQLFYSGPGKHFNWEGKVRQQISSYLNSKNALTSKTPDRMRLGDLKSIRASFFTSHDPGLSSFSGDQSISTK